MIFSSRVPALGAEKGWPLLVERTGTTGGNLGVLNLEALTQTTSPTCVSLYMCGAWQRTPYTGRAIDLVSRKKFETRKTPFNLPGGPLTVTDVRLRALMKILLAAGVFYYSKVSTSSMHALIRTHLLHNTK